MSHAHLQGSFSDRQSGVSRPILLVTTALFIGSLAVSRATVAAPAPDVLEVSPSKSAAAVVDTHVHVREKLPDSLFGFNIQHFNFQNDIWIEAQAKPAQRVVDALSIFKGAMYRYPGGLVANRFAWKQATGPIDQRSAQKTMSFAKPAAVLFGPAEYLDFVRAVDGMPFYVLNLVGWDEREMLRELPAEVVAASNAELAAFMRNRLADTGMPRYYQLGNELDRSEYQWPNEKYVQRAKATIEAIQKVDSDARFVAFLRDFNWRYRDDPRAGKVSRYDEFITDVLQGLPSVEDFSFQFYYDDPDINQPQKLIPVRLKQFQRAIDVARKAGHLQQPHLWVTEHARGVNQSLGNSMKRAYVTSNLAAAVSTGDFLIALAQMPEVSGAALHGLNAGPWQVFDATIHYRDLRPRPVYWGMRVLRAIDLPIVLQTRTASPNVSGYGGGYDVRAVALASEDGNRLGLWAVNRAQRGTEFRLNIDTWKGRAVTMRQYYLRGEQGVDADDPDNHILMEFEPAALPAQFSKTGELTLQLPPSSVSAFLIEPVSVDQ